MTPQDDEIEIPSKHYDFLLNCRTTMLLARRDTLIAKRNDVLGKLRELEAEIVRRRDEGEEEEDAAT